MTPLIINLPDVDRLLLAVTPDSVPECFYSCTSKRDISISQNTIDCGISSSTHINCVIKILKTGIVDAFASGKKVTPLAAGALNEFHSKIEAFST
ncbi:MAG: hypothetical protein IPN39_14785 [Chitinophagaceae bacterium]|nr:hypothetical protein [Chitinophagaceae bacterium]